MKKNIFTLLCVGSIAACAPEQGQQASYAAEEAPCPRYAKTMKGLMMSCS